MNVGFVGLSGEGAHMAGRVSAAGFRTMLWDPDPGTLAGVSAHGTTMVSTPDRLAADSEVVCVWGPRGAVVDQALRRPEGVLAAMKDGAAVVVLSPSDPLAPQDLQAHYPALHFLDVLVCTNASGCRPVVLVGGPETEFARCRALLETFGEPLHVGALGSSYEAKTVFDMVCSAHLALAAEVHGLVAARGLDGRVATALLAHGLGRGTPIAGHDPSSYSGGGLDPEALAARIGLTDSALIAAADATLLDLAVARLLEQNMEDLSPIIGVPTSK
jgi:3-hydroxyisobutyrate dehydrogenase-like beta-hydroxyacid dehydrogenase